MKKTIVAVLGAGALGAAIAARLGDTGHEVKLWNRTPDRARAAAAASTAVTAVAEGLGVTFTSHDSIRNEIALGYVEEARVAGLELRRDYVLVRPASREPSRLAEAFLAFCREELAVAAP